MLKAREMLVPNFGVIRVEDGCVAFPYTIFLPHFCSFEIAVGLFKYEFSVHVPKRQTELPVSGAIIAEATIRREHAAILRDAVTKELVDGLRADAVSAFIDLIRGALEPLQSWAVENYMESPVFHDKKGFPFFYIFVHMRSNLTDPEEAFSSLFDIFDAMVRKHGL
ncbi:MAG: hypothetical protein QXT16_08450 [Candidatus Caldarchaeum sp.]